MPPTPFGPPHCGHLDEDELLPLHERELQDLVSRFGSRLVVARSGTGKTCFLRRLAVVLDSRGDLPTPEPIQVETMTKGEILALEQLLTGAELTATWADIWQVAMLRSLATQVMCAPDRHALADFEELELRTDYPQLLGDAASCHTPGTAWTQVRDVLSDVRNARDLRRYLEQPAWTRLEDRLAAFLGRVRPVCMLMDLSDEHVSTIPAAWMSCQQGLLQALAQIRRSSLGPWFHVVVATREQHYVSLVHDRNPPGLRDYVTLLEFDQDDVKAFFSAKLSVRDSAEGLMQLIGATEIENTERGCMEDALDYLTRHTRSQPRDMVILGNDLARARLANAERGRPLDHAAVRRSVRGCARLYGDEQLQLCSQQLAASLPPGDTSQEQMYATPTAGGSVPTGVAARLHTFVRQIGIDRFPASTLDRVRRQASADFAAVVADVMWQNRLLGHIPEDAADGDAFFFSLTNSSTRLPRSAEYAFHPCLIDALHLAHGGQSTPPTRPISERAHRTDR